MTDKLRFKSVLEIEGRATQQQITLYESAVDLAIKYRAALEQIKLYHENMHGAKASTFIAYDIACKALEVCDGG